MKLKELSEVEILIMKSIWKLGDDITAYDIIEYLKDHYDRDYARSTVKTYINPNHQLNPVILLSPLV